MATSSSIYETLSKKEALELLRREILSAQITRSLDQKLKRKSSPVVLELANMRVPTSSEIDQAERESRSPQAGSSTVSAG